jgi:hypothetical protein
MQHVSAVAVLFLFSLSCTYGQVVHQTETSRPEEIQVSENAALIQSVLESSHTIALQVSPKDGVELLARAAEMAGKENPQRAKQWYLEAFHIVRDMPSGPQKTHYEVDIISHLAEVDSTGALSLLPTLEFPPSLNDCADRRAAPAAVFREFVKQHSNGWKSVAAIAQQLGASGNYPFEAIQIVIRQIASKHADDAAALVNQAIHYYNLGAHDQCSNNQLAALLAQHSKLVPGSTLKVAVDTLISSITERANAAESNSSNPPAPEEREQLRALDRSTISILMPLINSLEPERMDTLRQKHPSLFAATSPIADPEGRDNTVQLRGTPGSEMDISVVLSSHSQAPLQEPTDSQQDSDHETMPGVQTPSHGEVAAFLEASAEASTGAGDPEERLQVLLERGLLLDPGKQPAELSNTISDAFSLGDQLFRKSVDDNPLASWIDRPGVRTLSMMVEAVAKSAPRVVLDKIKNIQNSVLQAQLYVSFAKAMQSDPDSASVIVSDGE